MKQLFTPCSQPLITFFVILSAALHKLLATHPCRNYRALNIFMRLPRILPRPSVCRSVLFCVCHLPPRRRGVGSAWLFGKLLGVVYLRCLPVGVGFLEAGELREFTVTRDINRGQVEKFVKKGERNKRNVYNINPETVSKNIIVEYSNWKEEREREKGNTYPCCKIKSRGGYLERGSVFEEALIYESTHVNWETLQSNVTNLFRKTNTASGDSYGENRLNSYISSY